ncbi:MAG: cytochrome P460 family protein [Pseudomonadota bacterium]
MKLHAALFVSGLMASTAALAGPERVALPENYAERFVLYDKIDKAERKIVRYMCMNSAAHETASADQPLPDGTVLIMEDHEIELDGETPRTDANGRLIPTTGIKQAFVMEKQLGWGEEYPEEIRNGDWDYAWYLADGSPKADAEFAGCFECHKAQADVDFTFSVYPYLARR